MLQQSMGCEQLFALYDPQLMEDIKWRSLCTWRPYLIEVIMAYYATTEYGMRATFCSVWPQLMEDINGGGQCSSRPHLKLNPPAEANEWRSQWTHGLNRLRPSCFTMLQWQMGCEQLFSMQHTENGMRAIFSKRSPPPPKQLASLWPADA